jgi:hypothetical protein
MKSMHAGLVVAVLFALSIPTVSAAPPLPGAIFTTDQGCSGTNVNIFTDKGEVHLDGGPAHPGAAGLPDGNYWVRVTEPGGLVLGTSATAVATVTGGEFAECYQLAAILFTESSGGVQAGYDTTGNGGGEYKVWVSTTADFEPSASKTDNFKVKPTPPPVVAGQLEVIKFYDADADGTRSESEALITGWRVHVLQDHAQVGEPDHLGYDQTLFTPVNVTLDPGPYTVTESTPVETNWLGTTENPVHTEVVNGETTRVEFGNLCLGGGGGLTLGFWSNKNGQATMNAGTMATELATLGALNLRNASGASFDPATYASFRTWLLSANATNMAYMLSAQMAATHLNVLNGKVSSSALVYAPSCGNTGVGSSYITIADLLTAAHDALGANGLTVAASPERDRQECLKNALDNSNNNRNFVQAGACPFSFAQ